jgi:membrane protein YqaA with SNARE-associated domain
MLKRLYDWVLHWAATPYGTWALFLLAFAESSFFPIPPDVLLIAMCVARPDRSFKYAWSAPRIHFRGMPGIPDRLAVHGLGGQSHRGLLWPDGQGGHIETLYNTYDAWAVGIAGFTPIPYKVFTIAAGMFKINFTVFILASMVSRSARFFLVGGLISVRPAHPALYRPLFQPAGRHLHRVAGGQFHAD